MDDIIAIENLIKDTNLRKLESQFGGFNIFESIGAVRRELRHSDFLAFLLDPSANHQLFDRFIKTFLFRVAEKTDVVSVIDIDLLNYDDIQIRREWKNIDILIFSEQSGFVCAIENKVDSGESEGQLSNYHQKILEHFPKAKTQLFVFLTLDGLEASDPDNWISISYSDINESLKQLLKEHKDTLGHDIYFCISQYQEIIERHFMKETEVTEICRKIYTEHKQALDLIFDNRPDVQNELKDFFVEEIKSHSKNKSIGIKPDHYSKTYIRFSVDAWSQDKYPFLRCNKKKWTPDRHVLLFEIVNQPRRIVIDLVIGPGDDIHQAFRQTVFNELDKAKIKNPNVSVLSKEFSHATQFPLWSGEIEFENLEEVKKSIQEKLKTFFMGTGKKQFPNILRVVTQSIEQYSKEILDN